MRRVPLLLALLVLAACATYPPVDVGIATLRGQPAQVAFSYLGLPDEERLIAGTRMYVWSEGGIGTRPVYRPPLRPRHDPWFLYEPPFIDVPYSYACTLRLFVDARDVVTGGDVAGHGGGCGEFARLLAPLSEPR